MANAALLYKLFHHYFSKRQTAARFSRPNYLVSQDDLSTKQKLNLLAYGIGV